MADWSLRVWAPSLPGLFVDAARGMVALSGAQSTPGPLVERSLKLTAADVEMLLVAFLSELVYITEQERLSFDRFQVALLETGGEWTLDAQLTCTPLLALTRAIKAVTFHNLHISTTPRGYQVEIVFDV